MEPRHRLSYSKWMINGLILILLITGIVVILWVYTSRERFFYFWDYGGFHGVAVHVADLFMEKSPRTALAYVRYSLRYDYNYLFTLPILPFQLILGRSRLIYQVSVSLVYLLPFSLVMGFISSRLIQKQSRAVFWSSVLITLLIPMTWSPVVRGYPDIGGALCVALAVWVYVDEKIKKWRQIAGVGFLLAAAIMFRRHFAYAATAFFAAATIHILINNLRQLIRGKRIIWRNFMIEIICVVLSAAFCLLVLFSLDRSLLQRALTENYQVLYASYQISIIDTVQFLLNQFGWLLWGLALAGYILGTITKLLHPRTNLFIILLGGIVFIQWSVYVRQSGIQYPLHILFFLALGISALLWFALHRLRGSIRISTCLLLFACLGLNYAQTLGFTSLVIPKSLKNFLSFGYSPYIRSDYDEVARLIRDLHHSIDHDQPIYVVDSSMLMNYDIIRLGEEELFGKLAHLQLITSPQVDSRDFYPLEFLLQADTVIVSTPFQHHLKPDEQKTVQFVYDAFQQNWEIAQDYRKLPDQYDLEGGIELSIFRRFRSTGSGTIIRTFDQMRKYISRRPGGQEDWMAINPQSSSMYTQLILGNPLSMITGDQLNVGEELLYANPLTQPVKIVGNYRYTNPSCNKNTVTITVYNPSGIAQSTEKIDITSPTNTFDRVIPFQSSEDHYLVVGVKSEPGNAEPQTCTFIMEFIVSPP